MGDKSIEDRVSMLENWAEVMAKMWEEEGDDKEKYFVVYMQGSTF